MTKQLYNIAYLEQTNDLLKTIKEKSYENFLSLSEGTIADLGCGMGQDVVNLSQMVNPDVKIIGLDTSPEMINKAQTLNADTNRVSFMLGNVEALPFADNTLVGIRNERLIQHVHNPIKAFSEFYRVMQQEAVITVVETDWSSLNIYNGLPELARKVNDYFTHQNVANGAAGLHLNHYLLSSGFKNVALYLYPLVTHSFEQTKVFVGLDYVLEQMLEKQIFNKQEYNNLLNSLITADENGHYLASVNVIIATATK
jgi:ubiquinone/menaquinone biosynthesis C-methylase UbiE